MNIHEYQAKQLFRDYAIAVPQGMVADSPAQARLAAEQLPSSAWVVKAQIHAGARGGAGQSPSLDEVGAHAGHAGHSQSRIKPMPRCRSMLFGSKRRPRSKTNLLESLIDRQRTPDLYRSAVMAWISKPWPPKP